jgi:hypothetical protein
MEVWQIKKIGLFSGAATIAFLLILQSLLKCKITTFILLLVFCVSLNILPVLWLFKHRAKLTPPEDIFGLVSQMSSSINLRLFLFFSFLIPLVAVLVQNFLGLSDFVSSVLALSMFVGSLYYLVLSSQ